MLKNFKVVFKDGTVLRARRSWRQVFREGFGETIFTVVEKCGVAGSDDLVGREVRVR